VSVPKSLRCWRAVSMGMETHQASTLLMRIRVSFGMRYLISGKRVSAVMRIWAS
jgi:hypothetical protein